MKDKDVVVSGVVHPTTGEVLALEIVTNDGQVYFAAKPGNVFEGMIAGEFPNDKNGVRFDRVEMARL